MKILSQCKKSSAHFLWAKFNILFLQVLGWRMIQTSSWVSPWYFSQAAILTGKSRGQSSARHSLVTQCRKTVDIFWFLCLTKRNTSKEKRPIWLFPFSNTVVCGSLSHLLDQKHDTLSIQPQFCLCTPTYMQAHFWRKHGITQRKGHIGVHHSDSQRESCNSSPSERSTCGEWHAWISH